MKPSSSSSRRLHVHMFSCCWGISTKPTSAGNSAQQAVSNPSDSLCQVIDTPTRGDAILDLMISNTSELPDDVKTGGSLGCSDHALEEFTVLTDKCQVKIKVRILKFKKPKLQLFKEVISRTPWNTALRDKGAEQSW